MSSDDLKKFLENKIASLKKELEYYEYLLSLVESTSYINIKGNKGSVEVVKNAKGEVIAEIIYTPPLFKMVIKTKISSRKPIFSVLNKLLESEKVSSKIDYEIVVDSDELKEIVVKNVNDDIMYNKLKAGLQVILERIAE
ncbi:MAG: hypothetical protein OWQ54_07175 [Sulfolobaceae archaeon]|nr:hypothetical protein [Sulfolobaceae archaeon]